MKMQMDIVPYITGDKFDGLIPFFIEQKESIQDRMDFVEDIVRGKTIIHVGCLDHLPMIKDKINNNRWFHGRLTEVTKECLGIDINQEGIEILRSEINITNIRYANIESDDIIPEISSKLWDYIVFGEIIEHIDNPIFFSRKLSATIAKNLKRLLSQSQMHFEQEISKDYSRMSNQ
jgi:2-polyprenyl-3-methyl-5-hydroxy-6-metoxy-1,4-benzoquinol methylase